MLERARACAYEDELTKNGSQKKSHAEALSQERIFSVKLTQVIRSILVGEKIGGRKDTQKCPGRRGQGRSNLNLHFG